jgi:magnesium-transporting ATPase (P-type)
MADETESFWRRPFSKRASRVVFLLLISTVVLHIGWLGRKRLFVDHDRQYQLAFILFVVCNLILITALKAVAARARENKDKSTFRALQVWTGTISCLGVAVVGIFYDYTLSSLTLETAAPSVFTGVVLGVWNATSLKEPTIQEGS